MLVRVLEESLRMLHPFLSFITEEIYQTLPGHGESITVAPYPEVRPEREAPEVAARFESLQELVRLVRTLRSEFTVPPEKRINVHVRTEAGFPGGTFFLRHIELIRSLVSANDVTISDAPPARGGAIPAVGNGFEAFVFIREAIDVPKETEKLRKEIEKTRRLLESTERKLSNEQFLGNAPEQVVAKEREKLAEFSRKVTKMEQHLRDLSG